MNGTSKQSSLVFTLMPSVENSIYNPKLYSQGVSRYHLRSAFFLNRHFPVPLLLLLYLAARGEDTRATHRGAYRPSVSPATVTTGQCAAAAAQRTLCPTDTITIQDSRSPPSTVKHYGTLACDWCQCTGSRFFFILQIVYDNLNK